MCGSGWITGEKDEGFHLDKWILYKEMGRKVLGSLKPMSLKNCNLQDLPHVLSS